MEERWREVADFPRYLVSNLGRIKRRAHIRRNTNGRTCRIPEKLMRTRQAPNNKYPNYIAIAVDLRKEGGERKTVRVSRLVATAFVPNPSGFPVVNHIDNNPKNNRADNLEWTTYQGNSDHCKREGRSRGASLKGVDNPRCKHTLEQVKQAKCLLQKQQYTHGEIAEFTGMTRTAVSEISCGRRWKEIEA
jgi:hypothetical protein